MTSASKDVGLIAYWQVQRTLSTDLANAVFDQKEVLGKTGSLTTTLNVPLIVNKKTSHIGDEIICQKPHLAASNDAGEPKPKRQKSDASSPRRRSNTSGKAGSQKNKGKGKGRKG